jgi:hypothetical protein
MTAAARATTPRAVVGPRADRDADRAPAPGRWRRTNRRSAEHRDMRRWATVGALVLPLLVLHEGNANPSDPAADP